ncbi:MAG: C2H2-type zinc finger protein [Endozoicomonadaceae bacterium]|nr:C2H2-type zinc finger protein [Endozoicomonadaceae bacterium]
MLLIQKKILLFLFTVLALLLFTIMFNGLTPYAVSGTRVCTDAQSNQPNKQITQPVRKKEKTSYVCTDCKKIFDRRDFLDRHNCPNRKEEANNNLYECSECNACFFNQKNFIRHKFVHQQEKPFQCKICNKAFKTDFYLNQHMVTHLPKNLFICNECNKSFDRQAKLLLHQATEHNQTINEIFKCRYDNCDKVYLHKGHLDRHVSHKHSLCTPQAATSEVLALHQESYPVPQNAEETEESTKPTSTVITDTPTCPEESVSSPVEKIEISQTEEPLCTYTCKICTKTYKRETSLARHKMLKHLPCGEKFSDLDILKLHQKSCVACQKVINFKKKLKLQLIMSIKISDLPEGQISLASVQENYPDESYKRSLLLEDNLSEHILNQLPINDQLDIVSEKCTGVIIEITTNLSAIENKISENDYSCVIVTFVTIAKKIIQLKELIPLLRFVDSQITENENADKITMILNTFRPDLITLSNDHNVKGLVDGIRQDVNKVSDCFFEIVENWRSTLLRNSNSLKNKNIYLSDDEDISLSDDEDISLSDDEDTGSFFDKNISLQEDENIVSLHTDIHLLLDEYFITLPDNPMLQ